MLESTDVVADLLNVCSRRFAGYGSIEDLGDRRLGPFDPRTRHCLTGYVGVDEQVWVRKKSSRTGQSPKGGVSLG